MSEKNKRTKEYSYREFTELFVNLTNLGNVPDLPIGRVLALNMIELKKIKSDHDKKIDEIITRHAKIDESGNRVGVEYDDTDADGKITKKRKSVKGKYLYDDIDVENREAYTKEINEYLDKTKISITFQTIKSNKRVIFISPEKFKSGGVDTVSLVEKEMELLDVLERKTTANVIMFLLDNIVELVL